MKNSFGGIARLALLATGLQLLSLPAQALTVEVQGDVAVLGGSMDYPDGRRLKAAYEQGVRTFVLRRVAGGDMNAIYATADVLGDLKVRVVLDGVCSGGCEQLLAAGVERRFMPPTKDGITAVLIRGAMYYGDSTGPSNMPQSYALARSILAPAIPSELIRKHTNGSRIDGALVIIPDGSDAGVLDCDSLKGAPASCRQVQGLDGSSSGLFTNLEPWVPALKTREPDARSTDASGAGSRP
ncbi:hypothetical protein [Uliginosibacterium sp. H1]|uniref:hypothetical protein n=1 Tax=Uliginosibacterium sp. H1 TaxID=3114757 RepID=UPI002E194214|nr:hypothetical protein [Uliginosibacterium sp. H1]